MPRLLGLKNIILKSEALLWTSIEIFRSLRKVKLKPGLITELQSKSKMSTEPRGDNQAAGADSELADTKFEMWDERWTADRTGWHREKINVNLERYYYTNILGGKKTVKIFVPLCGKAVDLIWLYNLGNTVIGVEFVEKACVEFFTENNLSYTKEEEPKVKGCIFKSEDSRLKLYCCDLFLFNSELEGQFDAVWDRASYVAIEPCVRQRYSDLMQSLMAPWCRMLIETYEYDQTKMDGPPFSVPFEDVKEKFGTGCIVQKVRRGIEDKRPKAFAKDEVMHFNIFSIVPKAMKEYLIEKGGDDQHEITMEFWSKRWDVEALSFHFLEVHPQLKENYEKFVNGRSQLKIMVPLCGKSLDMAWLYNQGHNVIGVEAIPKACDDFFRENNIEFTKEEDSRIGGSVYKSKDGRLKIYCCDIFRFSVNIEGQFDAFWERGAFCAILPKDRERYSKVMTDLAGPKFTAIVYATEYDQRLWGGTPFSMSRDEVALLYGDKVETMELIHSAHAPRLGLEEFVMHYYYFKGK